MSLDFEPDTPSWIKDILQNYYDDVVFSLSMDDEKIEPGNQQVSPYQSFSDEEEYDSDQQNTPPSSPTKPNWDSSPISPLPSPQERQARRAEAYAAEEAEAEEEEEEAKAARIRALQRMRNEAENQGVNNEFNNFLGTHINKLNQVNKSALTNKNPITFGNLIDWLNTQINSL